MLLPATPGFAADIETLLMPGDVIRGHAKVESDCARCHARLRDTSQNALCLDCHEEVRKDIQAGLGFHGRSTGLGERECKSCHTDHIGRDADIVRLNKDSFDHRETDFPLEGAHGGLACDSCHAAGKPFRAAPGECIDCHREDDPHKGRLGEDCADCHAAKAWKDARFDHADTDFALEGAHRDVTCAACHPDQRYERTPTACNDCHALNDVHRGSNGTECADCHDEKRWDEPRFDHAQDTDFPLRGRHARIECEACHTGPRDTQTLKTECVACHRADDAHHGRYGSRCDSCHSERRWPEARFDHDGRTDFPLRGRHRDVACNTCHRGALEDALETDCVGCHRADDVHAGKQGEDCARCHEESGWGERVVFDHDLTRFPLIGLHAAAPCEECHVSTTFQQAATGCVECHRQDDTHERALGDDCARCHNPNGWALWEFDHDRATDFALEGRHRGLACEACHRDPARGAEVGRSQACNACHAADDRHRGRYGNRCDRCHNQESFEQVEMRP